MLAQYIITVGTDEELTPELENVLDDLDLDLQDLIDEFKDKNYISIEMETR